MEKARESLSRMPQPMGSGKYVPNLVFPPTLLSQRVGYLIIRKRILSRILSGRSSRALGWYQRTPGLFKSLSGPFDYPRGLWKQHGVSNIG